MTPEQQNPRGFKTNTERVRPQLTIMSPIPVFETRYYFRKTNQRLKAFIHFEAISGNLLNCHVVCETVKKTGGGLGPLILSDTFPPLAPFFIDRSFGKRYKTDVYGANERNTILFKEKSLRKERP